MTRTDAGWVGVDRDDPEVAELRRSLEADNGLRGLDIVEPDDVERAVRIFHRDGFVAIAHALDGEQLEHIRSGCDQVLDEIFAVDPDRTGNRGSHRYSFGASSSTGHQMHRPEWQMLVDLPAVTSIVTAIFGSSNYMLRGGGGDVCLPGAVRYQPLHADMADAIEIDGNEIFSFRDHRRMLSVRDLPTPYVCCNFMTVDTTRLNGPTRQIPGSQHSREQPPNLDDEPLWMKRSTVVGLPAGSMLVRDVRAWHGGTPNLSDEVRSMPNVEFYAPWYREPISPCIEYADYERMSDHAKRVCRFSVLDSSQRLDAHTILNENPFEKFKRK